MADLTIATDGALGPLTVEVLGPGGERVGPRLVLTSLNRRTAVQAVAPGDYTVVATRPSGQRLVSPARVGPEGGHAVIAVAGPLPDDSLSDAAPLGLISAGTGPAGSDFRLMSLTSPQAAGPAARSIAALLSHEQIPASGALSLGFDRGRAGSATRSARFTLACWRYDGKTWHRWRCGPPVPDGDYLHVRTGDLWHHSPWWGDAFALGLLGQDGFGPVVIVPPFLGGVDVTFLTAGVAMVDSAERAGNPSALRVPVALAMPRHPAIADLLVGLNAGILPDAIKILEAGREGDAPAALQPFGPAAILEAVFRARFDPLSLSLQRLRDLNEACPDIADSWLLLAWARALQGDGDIDWEMTITQQLRRASACRCTYLSRSRTQLGRLLLRYGPFPRARQESVSTPRRSRTGDYLDFGAEAGGLDAFWGHSPTRPGRFSTHPRSMPTDPVIRMREGRFVDLTRSD